MPSRAAPTQLPPAIEHPGETLANEFRRRLAHVEPHALRTFTPSLAVIARSAGSYHWTADGRKLADFSSGVLVTNLGHNPTRWWRRLRDYLELDPAPSAGEFFQAVPQSAYNAITPLEVTACERLIASVRGQPGGARLEQVLWAASGSEAIQKALWAALARRTESDIILATRHGFHGKKGLAGAVTGSESDPQRDPRVRFLSFPRDECRDVARRQQPLDLAPYRAELERLHHEFGPRLSCLITEPYLGGGGSYHPQPEYLQLLQAFCRQHDLLFILDEVQANFGRTGSLYAYTHYGLEPDIVVLGKGLGNGVPVSAAVGPAALFAALDYGEASDTWSANPLASAAVLATLDEFESTDILDRGRHLAAVLEAGLLQLTTCRAVAAVRGEGCVWGVECAAVGRHSAEQVAQHAVAACYLGEAALADFVDQPGAPPPLAIHLLGPLAGRVLRVSPPLSMAADEAQAYLAAMLRIFQDVALRWQD